jgi:hypothetical protein
MTPPVDIIALVSAIFGASYAVVIYGYQTITRRKMINKAFLAEISRLLRAVHLHRDWWIECIAKGKTDLPLIPFSMDIYDKFNKNIGDLKGSYGASAVRFYGVVKFINQFQETRDKHVAIKRTKDFDDTYLNVLNGFEIAFFESQKFDAAFKYYLIEKPYK